MNTKRLLKLAAYLSKLKSTTHHKFDMGGWFSAELIEKETRPPKLKVDARTGTCEIQEPRTPTHECRTSACALGHAALMPEFRRAGLHIELLKNCGDASLAVGAVRLRGFRSNNEFEIASKFFNIDLVTAYKIFGGNDCTARQKAEQIRALVRKYQRDAQIS